MNTDEKVYEPPKAKIYWFDENEQILTESGLPEPAPVQTAEYAARALNQLMGGTNTTIEID